MDRYVNLEEMQDAFIGDREISEIYLGNSLLWPLKDESDYLSTPFTVYPFEDIVLTFQNHDILNENTFKYTDDPYYGTWTNIHLNGSTGTLQAGKEYYFMVRNLSFGVDEYGNMTRMLIKILSTGNFCVSGNIMSLLSTSYQTENDMSQFVFNNKTISFAGLFSSIGGGNENTTLLSARNLYLPADTLCEACYSYMFYNCRNLQFGPRYLPAMTLTNESYYAMFLGCSSLLKAPDLPATTLVNKCYASMFEQCSSLNYIKCLATDLTATDCLRGWTANISNTGTFIKDANTTWPTGDSGIPNNWTVQNA